MPYNTNHGKSVNKIQKICENNNFQHTSYFICIRNAAQLFNEQLAFEFRIYLISSKLELAIDTLLGLDE